MKIWLLLSKEISMQWIAHLDYLRAVEKALRRAEWPLQFSEGFSPHPKISTFTALGVGVCSEGEWICVAISETGETELLRLVQQFRSSLPIGIKLKNYMIANDKINKSQFSRDIIKYSFFYEWPEGQSRSLIESNLNIFNQSSELQIVRKNEKKNKNINVKDFLINMKWQFNDLELQDTEQCFSMILLVDVKVTVNGTLRPWELVTMLSEQFCIKANELGDKITVTRLLN